MNNTTETEKGHIVLGILRTMSGKEKAGIVLLAFLGIFRALAEMLSTGAVLPYMYVLVDTEKAKQLPVLKTIAKVSGDDGEFIIFATLLFIFLYAFRCVYLVFYDYVNGKIIRKLSADYSIRLFRYYMTRPYEFFFARNSALLQRNVTTVISNLMQGVISNGLYLISYVLTIILLLCMLVSSGVSWLMLVAMFLGILYLLLSRDVKRRAKIIAGEANVHSKILHKMIMECFIGFKDIKLNADEENIRKYVSKEYEEANALRVKRNLINSVPNEILELGTVVILAVILVIGYKTNGMQESLAVLSLCGATAIRIRSVLSGILTKVIAIKDNSAYYDEIINDIRASKDCDFSEKDEKRIDFKDGIEVKNLRYRYPNTDMDVLRNFNLIVHKGEAVGITGHSGRGKTTLADLLTGLIAPDEGDILIGGVSLIGHESAWRKTVGYVPQSIYLIDGSILENVALYEPFEVIDRERVRSSLQTAQLLEFVDSLPKQEDSLIGENGILLSGGQRQRIGIARALYKTPEVLIFDEATNSLDDATEKAFIDTVNALRADYTMIVISHRRETLERCDRVVEI